MDLNNCLSTLLPQELHSREQYNQRRRRSPAARWQTDGHLSSIIASIQPKATQMRASDRVIEVIDGYEPHSGIHCHGFTSIESQLKALKKALNIRDELLTTIKAEIKALKLLIDLDSEGERHANRYVKSDHSIKYCIPLSYGSRPREPWI